MIATWNCDGVAVATASEPAAERNSRIWTALGSTSGRRPDVDEETLLRYYTCLSARLSLPFTAYYPLPATLREKTQFRCTVVELLDPAKHLGDVIDGIFCKTRKGKYELNLPLAELHLPDESPHSRWIEDYCYWLRNWR